MGDGGAELGEDGEEEEEEEEEGSGDAEEASEEETLRKGKVHGQSSLSPTFPLSLSLTRIEQFVNLLFMIFVFTVIFVLFTVEIAIQKI